ncbi:MAG: NAD(P)H-hydrate epimerase [Planctomycetes bacterium]|nr:NAD(P)H-hydrate epimerase [Planctomycetota bacterium]
MVDFRACGELGIPSICLMENAGAGAARVALDRWSRAHTRFACVCGPGQNGGDAFVVARHLAVAGHDVRILVFPASQGDCAAGDAAVNLGICRALRLPIRTVTTESDARACLSWLAGCDVVVDGLFGTGLTRPIAGVAASLVEAVDASKAEILALDVPSGLDCDTGLPLGPCVRADVTATFVAPKVGFANPASVHWTGEVVVVGIGAPAEPLPPQI